MFASPSLSLTAGTWKPWTQKPAHHWDSSVTPFSITARDSGGRVSHAFLKVSHVAHTGWSHLAAGFCHPWITLQGLCSLTHLFSDVIFCSFPDWLAWYVHWTLWLGLVRHTIHWLEDENMNHIPSVLWLPQKPTLHLILSTISMAFGQWLDCLNFSHGRPLEGPHPLWVTTVRKSFISLS